MWYVALYVVFQLHFEKNVTVSTHFDVFPFNLDTLIRGESRTGDINRSGVKITYRSLTFGLSFPWHEM